jgi:CYTH domain-containing protein
MVLTRQFLISPALARLIRKERGVQGRVREGYFSSTPERTHFVRLEPPHCSLMMQVPGPHGEPIEEATEVPQSQAQALLDVAPGQIAYDRTALVVAPGVEGVLEQVLMRLPLHLLTVTFEGETGLERFELPLWAGPEVSGDPAFSKAGIALQGEPDVGELEISNAALEALLDLLQSRSSSRNATAHAAWDYVAHRVHQPSPMDEQLLVSLAQALGSGGEDSARQQEDALSNHAPGRARRSAG